MEIEVPKQPKKKPRVVPSFLSELTKAIITTGITSGYWWSCGKQMFISGREVTEEDYPIHYIEKRREDALVIPDIIAIHFDGEIITNSNNLMDSVVETLVEIIKQTANKWRG